MTLFHDVHHVTLFMTNIMYSVKWYSNRGEAVRVTRKQAAANREKVLDVAGTLFRERGFDGIGVADIMKRAGLTHGGFYGQFASKDDLAAETTARVLGNPGWQERLTGKADPSFGDVVRGYLSPRHRDDPGTGCLIAALGSDAARQPRAVRRALTDGFRVRLDAWLKLVPGRSAAARREKALVTMATLVGALILARAVDDPALSDEILEATATELNSANSAASGRRQWCRPSWLGHEREGCHRAVDVVLHHRCTAHTDRADHFSVHLDGKPAAPRSDARKRGNAGQQRRVALDKVEEVLRWARRTEPVYALFCAISMVGIDAPSIRLKALRLPPSSRIATFSATPSSLAFATACIHHSLCELGRVYSCFSITLAIGPLLRLPAVPHRLSALDRINALGIKRRGVPGFRRRPERAPTAVHPR